MTLALGISAFAALFWVFLRMRSDDRIGELMTTRRGSSRIVSRAHYLIGVEELPVALSLGHDAVHYENPDLQASLELARIDEIEYDDEASTGQRFRGRKALRLRSHGNHFEFLLDNDAASVWQMLLAPRRMNESDEQHETA